MTASAPALSNVQLENRATPNSPMLYARLAGILYLIITLFAIIAHFYVPDELIVSGDAAATANNIMENESLFRIGIGSEVIVLLSEIILSIILYVLLAPVNKTVSLIAAVSRLTMTTIHGINLINYFFVLLLLDGSITAFDTQQVNELVMLFLDAHTFGFTIGISFLSIHVFALGYLIFQSGYFPRILGVLFLIAAIGYLFDSTALLMVSSYEETPAFVAMSIAIAEIAFPLWLLVKGVNQEGWQKRIDTNNG